MYRSPSLAPTLTVLLLAIAPLPTAALQDDPQAPRDTAELRDSTRTEAGDDDRDAIAHADVDVGLFDSLPSPVEGMIYDSASAAPLAGARVTLVEGGDVIGATVTSRDGGFSFRPVRPGHYELDFQHPHTDEFRYDPDPVPVEVDGSGQRIARYLSIPSWASLITRPCDEEMEPIPEGLGARLGGFVRSGDSEVGIPGATVSVEWRTGEDEDAPTIRIETSSDRGGRFYFCAVPARWPFRLQASFLGMEGTERRVVLQAPDRAWQVDLSVLPRMRVTVRDQFGQGADTLPTSIRGRVVDAESGRPIADAVIRARAGGDADESRFTRLTDAEGRFAIEDMPHGEWIFEIEHVAYGGESPEVAIGGGGARQVVIYARETVTELAPLTVTTRRADPVEDARRRSGTRLDVITRAEIEEDRTARNAGDLMRGRFPGIQVRILTLQDGDGAVCLSVARSGLVTGGAAFNASPRSARPLPDEGVMGPSRCPTEVAVVVDGFKLPDPEFMLRDLSPTEIESIEFLSAIQAGALYGPGTQNGAVVIWTRGNGPYAESR